MNNNSNSTADSATIQRQTNENNDISTPIISPLSVLTKEEVNKHRSMLLKMLFGISKIFFTLTYGLGYGGFTPGQTVQRLEDSLTHASDASPDADGRVRAGAEPGENFLYSGGGYALLQLVIEEVSGEPFNDYMQRAVLRYEPGRALTLEQTTAGWRLTALQ